MRKIRLTQGKFVLVSDKDYTFLNQWKWYYNIGYATRTDWSGLKQKQLLMHRLILERMGFKNFAHTDHRDENKLNNQRRNLRPATHAQNLYHRGRQKNNLSGYKGVCWDKDRGKWRVYIREKGILHYLGLFMNKIAAAKRYDKAARKYFGKFAKLNFN